MTSEATAVLEIDQAITTSTPFHRARAGGITPNGEDLIATAMKTTKGSGTVSAAEQESMAQGTAQKGPDTSRKCLFGVHLQSSSGRQLSLTNVIPARQTAASLS